MKNWPVVSLIAAALLFSVPTASAQTPRAAPSAAFIFLDETPADRFVIQRWISAANPEVSPAGFLRVRDGGL